MSGLFMNSPEKKILHLAFCLFVVGVVVRLLPWGLPAIEQNEIAELSIKTTAQSLDSASTLSNAEYSKMEYSPKGDDASRETGQGLKKEKKKKAPKVSLPISINKASADELCALNGVGPKLAEKIVAFRNAHGAFKKPEDLQKVPGIGKKKSEKLLQGLIFD